MNRNQVFNAVGIACGGLGITIGLTIQWESWTWISLAGFFACLVAAPTIWRKEA